MPEWVQNEDFSSFMGNQRVELFWFFAWSYNNITAWIFKIELSDFFEKNLVFRFPGQKGLIMRFFKFYEYLIHGILIFFKKLQQYEILKRLKWFFWEKPCFKVFWLKGIQIGPRVRYFQVFWKINVRGYSGIKIDSNDCF